MALVSADSAAAKRLDIPKKVGEEYLKADKERGKAALRKLPKKVDSKRGKTWRHQGR